MRILIVEDERVAARGLERMVRALLGARITSIRIQESLTASECYVEDNPVDLVLLDLNLRGEDGFQLLSHASAASFQTIVVSANTDRALEAFTYGVIDFVPKPVLRERLSQAVERYENGSGKKARYVSVKKDDKVVLIPLSDVLYFQGQDNYAMIHTSGGSVERHRKTLESLAKILPENFVRVHKSFLVDRAQIKHVRAAGGRYAATLHTGQVLPVSRARAKELLRPAP